eukprot:TRINITY_DN65033_c0_g1_i1.p1 TRINITY_DN65033_c0_g1~~TRINITY_DN65033_c0_g1_i1.p1  ORF type:complete len:730 (+),score=145.92 TRINITY_DN65033_c0_g1_i1:67-2256(+)
MEPPAGGPTEGAGAPEGAIRRLPREVIDRIAAGEIVQRPSHAVKELLENALDAGATRVDVSAKDGGLAQLCVADDGVGIAERDMPLVCERFATSKIRAFEDLPKVSTFGFRGEALSALSHVARVTVRSRTRSDALMHTAKYANGVMQSGVTRAAGAFGTCVVADKLFHTLPTRRQTMCKSGTEYRKVADVVRYYALAFHHRCSFSCRKDVGAVPDVSVPAGQAAAGAVRRLWGPGLAEAMRPVRCEKAGTGASFRGFVSGADWRDGRRAEFVLFINGRLVECKAVARAVGSCYEGLLAKGQHPWAFLDITVPPDRVDVNVDPNKRWVALVDEEAVARAVEAAVSAALRGGPESSGAFRVRCFSSPPRPTVPDPAEQEEVVESPVATPQGTLGVEVSLSMPRAKVPRLVGPARPQCPAAAAGRRPSDAARRWWPPPPGGRHSAAEGLLADCEDAVHPRLCDAFSEMEWVGNLDSRRVVVAARGSLFLVDLQLCAEELLRQQLLSRASSAPAGRTGESLRRPARVADLCAAALSTPEVVSALGEEQRSQRGRDDLVARMVDTLTAQQPVLSGLFGITIDASGLLRALPAPVPGYQPPLVCFPLLLLRLCSEVPWESKNERRIVDKVAREIALHFAPLEFAPAADPAVHGLAQALEGCDSLPGELAGPLLGGAAAGSGAEELVRAMRRGLAPPRWLAERGAVVELATLPQLLDACERGRCEESCMEHRAAPG